MTQSMKRGSTSVRRLIFIGDSTSTTGAGLTGLVYNSAGLTAYYIAGDLANAVAISLVDATVGTWTSGGFKQVNATNMPGWYEIGIPNAALDGGNEVAIHLQGATNMVPVPVYIELDTVDYQTAVFGGYASGAAIASVTGLTASNLDATVSSRASQTSVNTLIDGIGWTLASLYGACANPQAADALVQLTINGYVYSGQYAGLTSTGVRTAPTLSKV